MVTSMIMEDRQRWRSRKNLESQNGMVTFHFKLMYIGSPSHPGGLHAHLILSTLCLHQPVPNTESIVL